MCMPFEVPFNLGETPKQKHLQKSRGPPKLTSVVRLGNRTYKGAKVSIYF